MSRSRSCFRIDSGGHFSCSLSAKRVLSPLVSKVPPCLSGDWGRHLWGVLNVSDLIHVQPTQRISQLIGICLFQGCPMRNRPSASPSVAYGVWGVMGASRGSRTSNHHAWHCPPWVTARLTFTTFSSGLSTSCFQKPPSTGAVAPPRSERRDHRYLGGHRQCALRMGQNTDSSSPSCTRGE